MPYDFSEVLQIRQTEGERYSSQIMSTAIPESIGAKLQTKSRNRPFSSNSLIIGETASNKLF